MIQNRSTDLSARFRQRMHFQRASVRLYDAVIMKVETMPQVRDSVILQQMKQIRLEEMDHWLLSAQYLEKAGTGHAVTESDVDAVCLGMMGFAEVIAGSKVGLLTCLDALLIAETTNAVCWELLVKLAAESGFDDCAGRLESAHRAELLHLKAVRGWIEELRATGPREAA